MSRARDNADLGDSYGALGAGVTGGSGLTAVNPANLASGVLPVGVTGGSGLTALGTVTSGTLSSGVVQVMPRNEGLIVEYKSATTVDIDADYLTVYDTNNYGVVLSNVNLTMTITSTGANGRSVSENSGSETASDWYHLWVIYNGSTTACYGTLSASESAVLSDLPSGYTHLKYVGAIYNDSSSNLEGMYQVDNDVAILNANSTIVSAADISNITSYNIATFLPDNVTSAHIEVSIYDNDMAQYRSGINFLMDASYDYIIAGYGASEVGGTTYLNLLTIGTVKVSPIKSRTLNVSTSSSVGDHFNLYLRQYSHNNII